MKKSTLVFSCTQADGRVQLYRCNYLPLIDTDVESGYSVVRSLAAFMTWQFPKLPPPHIQGYQHTPLVYLPAPVTFPNYQSKLHPMYIEWAGVFCDVIEKNQAIQHQERCYFRVEVDEDYVRLLQDHEFEICTVISEFKWSYINPDLKEFTLLAPKDNPTKVVCVSFSDHHLWDQPYLDIRSHYYGLFFNNQSWYGYHALKDRPPTFEELRDVDVVIIPGSNLSVYDNHPKVVSFVEALSNAINGKPSIKILGICFGHQLLASMFGGKVAPAKTKSIGVQPIVLRQNIQGHAALLQPLRGHEILHVLESHGDEVTEVPEGWLVLADSSTCSTEIILSGCGRYLGIQCHPDFTSRQLLTHEIQVAHHQQKDKCHSKITELLEQMNNHKDDSGSEVLRELIRSFMASQ